MTKSHTTKAVLTLLTASLAFGSSIAWAETATQQNGAASAVNQTSTKQRFPDVSSTYWGAKYITKLSLLGIVEGNELGKYEPESSVTHEQVITMLVRMLGWEEEAKSLPSFYSELKVSDYAKPYLHMALEKGLILQDEELELSSGDEAWGPKNASREWVAKLLVRALGKDAEAAALKEKQSSFTDREDISSWAVGYINEAVELKLVEGMEDGSFQPLSSVTRAQVATFLSRATPYLSDKAGFTATGIIDSVSEQNVVVTSDLGEQSTYNLTQNTVYYGLNKTVASSSEVLKANDRAYFIVSGGNVLFVEVMEEGVQTDYTLQGDLVSLDLAAAQLVLSVGGVETTAELQIPPVVLDADGKGLNLSTLVKGSALELQRTGSKAKYSTIIVKRVPVNKTVTGVVQSVNLAEGRLSVADNESGIVEEFPLADEVGYTYQGALADLNALKARDVVTYRVDTDKVVQIELITPYEEPSDSGKLIDFRNDNNVAYVAIQKEGKKAIYDIAEGAEVVVSGLSGATFDDLYVGDDVKLMLTDDGLVYKVIVTNRSLKTEYLNTVVSFDLETKALTVKKVDGSLRVYELSDETMIDLSGTAVPYALGTNVLTKGKKLDITASSDTQVKTIRVVYSYEGVLASVTPSKNQLTLQVDGQLLTLDISSVVVLDLTNKSNPKLSDLAAGDYVRVAFDNSSSQTGINVIQTIETYIYRLINKDSTTRKLDFSDGPDLIVPTTVKMYDADQTTELAISALPLDEPYYIAYAGNSLSKVAVAPVSRGVIVSVDAAAGSVVFSEAGGAEKTVTVGTGARVKRDGAAAIYGLSELKAGDRVELIKESNGAYFLYAASVLSKKASYYDQTTNGIYVLRESLNDVRYYSFHSKAYIHKGSETLSSNAIAENDSITIYLLDGKVIELEKQ